MWATGPETDQPWPTCFFRFKNYTAIFAGGKFKISSEQALGCLSVRGYTEVWMDRSTGFENLDFGSDLLAVPTGGRLKG
jgi:hypothetical protein